MRDSDAYLFKPSFHKLHKTFKSFNMHSIMTICARCHTGIATCLLCHLYCLWMIVIYLSWVWLSNVQYFSLNMSPKVVVDLCHVSTFPGSNCWLIKPEIFYSLIFSVHQQCRYDPTRPDAAPAQPGWFHGYTRYLLSMPPSLPPPSLHPSAHHSSVNVNMMLQQRRQLYPER